MAVGSDVGGSGGCGGGGGSRSEVSLEDRSWEDMSDMADCRGFGAGIGDGGGEARFSRV